MRSSYIFVSEGNFKEPVKIQMAVNPINPGNVIARIKTPPTFGSRKNPKTKNVTHKAEKHHNTLHSLIRMVSFLIVLSRIHKYSVLAYSENSRLKFMVCCT